MRTLMTTIAGLALVAAGCGSDAADSGGTATTASAETASTEPPGTDSATTNDSAGGDVPERVVSLSPTHTEIMFAIGADDLLVAVDDFSNDPAAALDLPNDLSAFEPSVEAIAAYEPDLVLIGGDFNGLGDQLAELGIDSWDGPAATSFDDTYTQIEQLGAVTGHIGEAAELVSSMQTSIAEIADSVPTPETPLTYYHELGPELFTATSSTFIGEVYGIFGLENIADPLEGNAGQYPQLNAEALVDANPDLIFLADTKCCGESAATVADREGFGAIAAVENGNVVELDDDIASRWGPRVVDYVEIVNEAVQQAAVSV